jgi:hypothetical protein
MKLKRFCKSKETFTRWKIQCIEWEKIFSNYSSDKGLIIRIHRKVKEPTSQRFSNPVYKSANELNRQFSKEV